MALIVQKFGGTSVADLERIRNVAKRIIKTYDQGHDVVVILSAMSGVTDNLIDMADKVTEYPENRELDVLLATGEQTTVALLAMTLRSMNYPALSLLGHQVEVLTSNDFGRARIASIGKDRIQKHLDSRQIVIVAGFQGCDDEGNITTLGRGGSDTSAVAIASALKAETCEIYTDVDGIYAADPNICPKARKLEKVSYDEMLEMSSLGAKVLQIRSVNLARKYTVRLHVRSSFSEEEGSMVVHEDELLERLVISGITCKKEARITIRKVPNQPGVAAKVFVPITDSDILVDMIVQNLHEDGKTDISFTVPREDYKKALQIEKKIAEEIGAQKVSGDESIAKVSVIGVGIKSYSGVASGMFETLAKENINILLISTSEIRISCIIEDKYSELAVRVLHTAFGLDRE